MKLTVIGSGDAFNSAGRYHSCYLVEEEGVGPLMIDFGATALSALRHAGREPNEVKGFLFTHLHGDHIGGFPFLLIDAMFNSFRSEKLDVLGPLNTSRRLQALSDAAYFGFFARPKTYEMAIGELSPNQEAHFHGVKVETFAADHMDPPDQPLCLRLTMPSGLTVAFSGDTAMCDGLRAAAKGVDLLVAECSGMRPPMGRHCTWENDWKNDLPIIGAKKVLLSHLNGEVRSSIDALLQSAPKGVDLLFADDGLVLELNAEA